MSGRRPVRLALLGCGWIAQNRLRQIAADGMAEVVLLIDPATEACATVHRMAPDARVERDLRMLTRDRADAVMISTPTGLHAEQAATLLERGLPVFVQKPLGISTAEVARVLDAAARNDLPIDTDFCYRDLASARAVRDQFLAAAVGRAYYVEACFHNAYRPSARWSADPRLAGGGALIDLGIHLIDLVGWVTGQGAVLRDVHLRQRGRSLPNGEVEDFAKIELCLDDGAEVQIVTSWDASIGRDAAIRLTVYGENGNLELVNRDGSFFHFDARRCCGTWVDPLAADDSDDWQAAPLRRWLQRVRDGAGYEESQGLRRTSAIIDAAYALGRQPPAAAPGLRAPAAAARPEVLSQGVST